MGNKEVDIDFNEINKCIIKSSITKIDKISDRVFRLFAIFNKKVRGINLRIIKISKWVDISLNIAWQFWG